MDERTAYTGSGKRPVLHAGRIRPAWTSLVCALQADPGDDRVFETFYQATYRAFCIPRASGQQRAARAGYCTGGIYCVLQKHREYQGAARRYQWLHRVTHSIARDYREKPLSAT